MIVLLQVFTVYFHMVLWTKDHDGGGKPIMLQLVLQLLQEGVDAVSIRYSPSLEVFKGRLDIVLMDVVSGE